MSREKSRSAIVPELDGIRALAILGVLAFHLLYGHVPGGFLGVDLFFVLSGFLITSLLAHEHSRTGTISLRNFYARRALRILPPLIATIILAIVVLPGTKISAVAPVILFYANLVPDPRMLDGLTHTWSLSIEEQFYLAWPLLFLCLRRWRVHVLAAVVFLAVAARILLLVLGAEPVDIQRYTVTRIDSLALGCLAALCFRERRFAEAWAGKSVVANASLVAICACFFVVALRSLLSIGFTVFAALCAICILSVQSTEVHTLARRLLSSRPLQYIGQRSYGLYLYHHVVHMALERFRIPHDFSNFVVVLSAKIAITFLVAEISYRTIEAYAASFKERFRPSGATQAIQPEATPQVAGERN